VSLLSEQPLPSFERPILSNLINSNPNDERKLTQLHCKEEIIKWLISILLIDNAGGGSATSTTPGGSNNSYMTSEPLSSASLGSTGVTYAALAAPESSSGIGSSIQSSTTRTGSISSAASDVDAM
jgi:hypothetical protein